MWRAELGWKRKLVLGLLVSGFVLAAPELLLRICHFRVRVPRPPVICAWPGADEEMQDLGFFLQPDPDCFYDLRPGARYAYFGTPMDVIQQPGLRGPFVERQHANWLRIACFGDSSTFGMCVSEPLTWVRQLEGLLRERRIGNSIELLNAGVIGYTVYQGRRKYEAKIRSYQPHLVLLAFGAINEQLPAMGGSDPERGATWAQDFRYRAGSAADWLWRLRTVQLLGQPLLLAREKKRQQLVARCEAGYAKLERGETYDPRMSYAEFEQCLRGFVDEIRADGATPILINPHRQESTEKKYPQVLPLSQVILQVAADMDTPLFDANELFKRAANYETEYFADSHHPNAAGNRFLAESMADFLDDFLTEHPR